VHVFVKDVMILCEKQVKHKWYILTKD
jgi:hypothetical protein